MSETWRLLPLAVNDGAWNMAVDVALQRSRAAGGPPTLRLYRWSRPTVSLGRFQRPDGIDLGACERFGCDVVWRPTGGRGVLHDDEVTYSVVASEADGVPRGVTASYRHLGRGLVEAYRLLGVDAALIGGSRGERGSAACYLSSTQADLALGSAKLSGSAQTWQGGVCLQHGSFVVRRDVAREAAVFRLGAEDAERLAREAVTIEEATFARPSWAEVASAVADGFASALAVELAPGDLTEEEREAATSLVAAYAVAPLPSSRASLSVTSAKMDTSDGLHGGRGGSGMGKDDHKGEDTLLHLEKRSNEELREMLNELYEEEQRISYRRRVLHGKIDILRAELVRRLKQERATGGDVISGTDIERLISILSNDLRGVSNFDISDDEDDEED